MAVCFLFSFFPLANTLPHSSFSFHFEHFCGRRDASVCDASTPREFWIVLESAVPSDRSYKLLPTAIWRTRDDAFRWRRSLGAAESIPAVENAFLLRYAHKTETPDRNQCSRFLRLCLHVTRLFHGLWWLMSKAHVDSIFQCRLRGLGFSSVFTHRSQVTCNEKSIKFNNQA